MNLRELRKKAGLTQVQLSKAAGIDQRYYTNIETGKRTPSVKTAKALANVLGIAWTSFFSEEDDKSETLGTSRSVW